MVQRMPRKWPVFQTAVETGGSRHLVCPDTKRVSDSLFTTELQLDAAAAVRASNAGTPARSVPGNRSTVAIATRPSRSRRTKNNAKQPTARKVDLIHASTEAVIPAWAGRVPRKARESERLCSRGDRLLRRPLLVWIEPTSGGLDSGPYPP